jgi:hypothetical protein
MTEIAELGIANAGDALHGADLQSSIDWLIATADALNLPLSTETSIEAAQGMGRAQQRLRSMAMSLTGTQIDLLAGEAQVTAKHINAAVNYANGVIEQMAEWKKRIEKIGSVVDFLAVVLTGNGAKIVQAAGTLKKALGKA